MTAPSPTSAAQALEGLARQAAAETAIAEGHARSAAAECAYATAQAQRALALLGQIRALCASHEQIPGSPYSHLISQIDSAAAAAEGPL